MSCELVIAVMSLKQKLKRLSHQLENTNDYEEMTTCLASMSSTVSVLEKIKKL